MTDDRRASGVLDRRSPAAPDRRNGHGAKGQHDGSAARDAGSGARDESPSLRKDTVRLLEQLQAPDVEDSSKHTTRLDQISKLRRANEHLIIASLQSQILVEEAERSKAAMEHLANHDFLTNLPNRVQLCDRIAQAIAVTKRHKAKLAVVYMDLDKFKAVNDRFGHTVGDQLLQTVAHRLRGAMRSADTISRQGGDEFVLLLTEIGDVTAVAETIEKIRRIVTAPYSISGNTVVIGASVGASIYPADGEDVETLIRNADAAMYHAKEHGRNRCQFYQAEIRERLTQRDVDRASLLEALDKQLFSLFYQAQIDLESGAIAGVEALIRWRHPNKGLMLPGWFLPVAENCGAIIPIGRWVLREACGQAQSWRAAGLAVNVIAVNISASEFENEDFLDNVLSVLQETGLAPGCLELELTETVLLKDFESTSFTLDALRAMGIRISIDDFGTGYSSLSYLKRLPVDTMKVDRTFINDISPCDDNILLNAIIGIGTGLHYRVVAEGVETRQQLAFLREKHCLAAQGFYFNVPMGAEEFAVFLRQGVPATLMSS